jgi:hypothetical protein
MLKNLPTWLRAAVISAVQAAVAAVLVVVLSLIVDVQAWVEDPSDPVEFRNHATAVFAALMAAAQAIVVAVHRAIRPVEDTYPEQPTDGPVVPNPKNVAP